MFRFFYQRFQIIVQTSLYPLFKRVKTLVGRNQTILSREKRITVILNTDNSVEKTERLVTCMSWDAILPEVLLLVATGLHVEKSCASQPFCSACMLKVPGMERRRDFNVAGNVAVT